MEKIDMKENTEKFEKCTLQTPPLPLNWDVI